jgi:hypothetical protein
MIPHFYFVSVELLVTIQIGVIAACIYFDQRPGGLAVIVDVIGPLLKNNLHTFHYNFFSNNF